MPESDRLPADVRWRITREQLFRLRHHIHPIPLGRGLHEQFVATNWPGLTFKRALQLAGSAKVWVKDRTHFSGMGVAARVKELHILRDGSTRVIGFTRAEQLARANQPDEPNGPGGFLMRVDPKVFDEEGGLDRLAEQIFRALGGTEAAD